MALARSGTKRFGSSGSRACAASGASTAPAAASFATSFRTAAGNPVSCFVFLFSVAFRLPVVLLFCLFCSFLSSIQRQLKHLLLAPFPSASPPHAGWSWIRKGSRRRSAGGTAPPGRPGAPGVRRSLAQTKDWVDRLTRSLSGREMSGTRNPGVSFWETPHSGLWCSLLLPSKTTKKVCKSKTHLDLHRFCSPELQAARKPGRCVPVYTCFLLAIYACSMFNPKLKPKASICSTI